MNPPSDHVRDPPARVTVVGTRSLASAEDRRAEGLDHWIDGSFGMFRRRGRTVVLSPNGPRIARHGAFSPTGRRHDGALGRLIQPEVEIVHRSRPMDHASGGPLYDDRRRRQVLVVYHGELHRQGDPRNYFSFLGLGVSRDDGATIVDLGWIVAPDVDPDVWLAGSMSSVEIGPGGFVEHDGRFHLYFQDTSAPNRVNLGVATADVEEVCAAASEGRGVAWVKERESPGPADALGAVRELFALDAAFRSIEWFDVAYHDELRRFVLVYSSAYLGRWNHFLTVSSDGRTWSPAVPIHPRSSDEELLYVTLSSGDPTAQRHLTGAEFQLYFMRSAIGGFDRWRDATLELATVALTVPGVTPRRAVPGRRRVGAPRR